MTVTFTTSRSRLLSATVACGGGALRDDPVARGAAPWRRHGARAATGRTTATIPAARRFSPLTQITPAERRHADARVDVRHRRGRDAGDAARHRRRDVRHGGREPLRARAGDREGPVEVLEHRHVESRPGLLARRRADGPAVLHGRRRRPDDRRRRQDRTSSPTDFGTGGSVDLKASVSVDGGKGSFGLPSPPAVYRNIVITGGTNGEGAPATGRLYGDIRGWDARTGKMVWTFHTVPRPGEPGSETWPEGAYKNRSGTNAWGFITVDVERGLVFVPLGSPTDGFLRRRSSRQQSLWQLARRAGCGDRQGEVVPAARAPRSVGLRSGGAADAHRRAPRRPGDSRRRADHEDGDALHVQPGDRRTAVRHGGAAGAADGRPRRVHRRRRSRFRSSRRRWRD